MSFFKSLFQSKKTNTPEKKQSGKAKVTAVLKIKNIEKLTSDAVKIELEVPLLLKEKYEFQPGQYVNLILTISGKEQHRSYSICSDVNETLAIGVKKVENGIVSTYLNDTARAGQKIKVSSPQGNFVLPEVEGEFVAIAAGSGITPILSQAKMINRSENAHLTLIYGNRTVDSVMFQEELANLNPEKIKTISILSEQEKEGYYFGMMTEEVLSTIFEENPEIISAKGFYICGPEPVLLNAKNTLQKLGVAEDKIHFELFTTPTSMESKTSATSDSDFQGVSQVKLILDGEVEEFELETDGDSILEEAESYGIDAPYSCRGGICSTCKAKVMEGSARMDKNFTLSDEEVKEGYILTCQAHPTSEKITVSYDE